MPRVASLFLPNWPTDRLRRQWGKAAPPAEVPLILAGRDGGQRVICALDNAARRVGLRMGEPVAKAQALVPGLLIEEADPAADAKALGRLALWALQNYAPIAAADPPDGLIIDTTGAAHLYGGEEAMLEKMLTRLARTGIAARAALADSPGAAHALARFGARPIIVVPPGENPQAILDLPIAALRLPGPLLEELRLLGFERIGELAATPRAPLTLRFGLELGRRLDQALGDLAEPIDPARPPELIEVRCTFAEPIGAPETIARYIGRLTTELCARLEAKGLGARRLDLLLHRVDNRIEAIRTGMARPLRDAERLTRLLCDKIETIDPGFGIEILRLAVPLAEPLTPKQISSSFTGEPEADVLGLIDTLANRLGEEHLYRFAPVASDVPERAVRRIAPATAKSSEPWQDPWPRPVRLLPRPEPIETIALLPDHPPVTFTWRGIRRRIKRADGPERIFGEWWKRDAELFALRDYFLVEDETGERFWIFRSSKGEDAGSQCWFLHGIFG